MKKIISKHAICTLLIALERDMRHGQRRLRDGCRDEPKWQERAAELEAFTGTIRAWADELETEHYDELKDPRR